MSDDKKRGWRISRRGFLIGAGVAAGAVALGINVGVPYARLQIASGLEGAAPGGDLPTDPKLWFEIAPDNQITLYIPKVEMGQGTHTSLSQLAVEELEVEWAQLTVKQAGTHIGVLDTGGTSGSASVTSLWLPLRETAATLREMLRTQGATQVGKAPADLVARAGGFDVAGGERITYGAIVAAGDWSTWEVPATPASLKSIGDFTVIGQPVQRVDIPAKVTGENRYGFDARADGMLYGAALYPPTFEAKLRRLTNAAEVEQMAGVVKVVQDGEFVGVVAERRTQAWAARDALKAEWDEGRKWQQSDIDEIVIVGGRDAIVVQKEGDGAGGLTGTLFEQEYRTPFAVHAPLEPQAALADVQADRVIIHTSTQFPDQSAELVATALGRDKAQIELTPTYLGGGFGRKGFAVVAEQAARLSKAVGKPVHVGWNRIEEMKNGYHRPPTHNKLRATIENGRITAMEHQQASGDVLFSVFPAFLTVIFGADFGAYRGAQLPYGIPHRQLTAWRRQFAVPTGPWRGLGLYANTFAVESFMDEVAHSVGADPLQFRLDHLPDGVLGQRMRAGLEDVAQRSGWATPPAEGRARGVALTTDANTVVVQVAEVSVAEGKPRVHKVWAAMDCGVCINPDGAKAQVEGNIMWGVGSTLKEQMTIKDGAVDLTNFNSYPLLTMNESPDVEAVILPSPLDKPTGVGEPAIGPVGAAIANALFALTGKRVRTVPILTI